MDTDEARDFLSDKSRAQGTIPQTILKLISSKNKMVRSKQNCKVRKPTRTSRHTKKPGMSRFRVQSVGTSDNAQYSMSELQFEEEQLQSTPSVFPELQQAIDFMLSRKIPTSGVSVVVKPVPRKIQINGHLAFKIYYSVPNCSLSAVDLSKLFKSIWSACPDKEVWMTYADHYRSRERDISFKEWLPTVTNQQVELPQSQCLTPDYSGDKTESTIDIPEIVPFFLEHDTTLTPITSPSFLSIEDTTVEHLINGTKSFDAYTNIDPIMLTHDLGPHQAATPLSSSPYQGVEVDEDTYTFHPFTQNYDNVASYNGCFDNL